MESSANREVELAWVLVDGQPRHVSDFAGVSPRRRPATLCPSCQRPVTMKLGTVLAHHVAHQTGDECIAARGETALHLNTKLYLASQLRGATGLRILERCDAYDHDAAAPPGDVGCESLRTREWAITDWDDAVVELAVGSRRPDVSLLSGGKVVGAIEVLVSHAVDDEKAADLLAAGLPWLEIRAEVALYSGSAAWTPADPLPVHRSGPGAPWVCAPT